MNDETIKIISFIPDALFLYVASGVPLGILTAIFLHGSCSILKEGEMSKYIDRIMLTSLVLWPILLPLAFLRFIIVSLKNIVIWFYKTITIQKIKPIFSEYAESIRCAFKLVFSKL